MRPHVREFLELCAQTLVCPEPVVEIGAFQVAGQEAISDLRPLFQEKVFLGCDMQPGPGVDRIENIHQLSFRNGEVGTFILSDTLEHVADPLRAMREVHRCLRSDGVVIYGSVMNFPIHGYPNDYWRFTPEAFRALAADFAHAMIFFCGPKDFPHTVCGVATKDGYSPGVLTTLAERATEIKTTAPLIVEARVARVIQALMLKLMPDAKPSPPNTKAGLDRFSQPGWYLVNGQWLTGWTTAESVSEVEILAGDSVIHRARLTRPRPDVAERLKLADPEARIGFVEQVDLTRLGDYTGTLRMGIPRSDGGREIICESAPGLALGSVKQETQFVMHSFDQRPTAADPIATGHKLVAAIRERGESVQVDLGCGFRKNGNLGIDLTAEGTAADLVCRLGFEPIPLDDGVADSISCRDFLEHIPKAYYSEGQQTLRYPIIDLMNEIWRILKPDGTFTSFTPCYPTVAVHRDPTHLSVWTLESMAYFCSKYPVAKLYGVKTNFILETNCLDGFYLHAVLRKPASA